MSSLTPTQQIFLTIYDQGKSYKEICFDLDISLSTAKTHGKRILEKTGATCLRQAAYLLRLAA